MIFGRRYHERTDMGAGTYLPSHSEIDKWESYVEQRTDFHMGDDDRLDEEEARDLAEADAHKKFGFAREHFDIH